MGWNETEVIGPHEFHGVAPWHYIESVVTVRIRGRLRHQLISLIVKIDTQSRDAAFAGILQTIRVRVEPDSIPQQRCSRGEWPIPFLATSEDRDLGGWPLTVEGSQEPSGALGDVELVDEGGKRQPGLWPACRRKVRDGDQYDRHIQE
jgi:hypothetical protein